MCFIAVVALNKTNKIPLRFIQAFIQSEAKKKMFILLDTEYEQFYAKHKSNLDKSLKFKNTQMVQISMERVGTKL